ncbi:MAG: hypothetical protein WCC90_23460 [Methylocella sp.]
MPHAGLIADMMGNLYGTTSQGGGTKYAASPSRGQARSLSKV